MKYLITGGAGFIGSTLADKLIELGNEVVVVDDLSAGKKEYLNPKTKFYQSDICSDEIKNIFLKNKFDKVFHLAAQIDVRKSIADPELDNKINILGGLNILKNCRNAGIKKIIFSSSAGIYGDAPVPTREDCPPNPPSPYGINKLTFESFLKFFYNTYGLNYTALRFANVYGPRQYRGGETGVIAIFIDRAASGEKLIVNGDGMQTRDFIFVGDIVNALIKASESDFCGILNIGTCKESNLLEIIDIVEKKLNKKIELEFKEAISGEQRRSCLNPTLANKYLDWKAETSLENGIEKTLLWAKNK